MGKQHYLHVRLFTVCARPCTRNYKLCSKHFSIILWAVAFGWGIQMLNTHKQATKVEGRRDKILKTARAWRAAERRTWENTADCKTHPWPTVRAAETIRSSQVEVQVDAAGKLTVHSVSRMLGWLMLKVCKLAVNAVASWNDCASTFDLAERTGVIVHLIVFYKRLLPF